MRRPKAILSLIAFAALALVLLYSLIRERGEGPLYNGHRLSEWVEVFGRLELGMVQVVEPAGGDLSIYSSANKAITQAGTNAFPYLLKWIQFPGTPWRFRIPGLLRRVIYSNRKLEDLAVSHNELRKRGAIDAFQLLKTKVTPATIEELMRLLNVKKESDTAETAIIVLLELGAAGIPPLAKVLENPPHPMRQFAVRAIELVSPGLGPEAEMLVPGFIQCLSDNNQETRELAASALDQLKCHRN
jgi:hypothetical protein